MEVMIFNIDKDRRNLVDDKQNFNIDFHDSKYNWLQARQYEESMRQVEVHVVHGDGSPVDLTGVNPVFEGWLPEGVYRIIDAKHSVMIDAQNGIFRFDFPAPAFQIAGSYKQAFFRLMKDGMSVTTLEFSLDVMADKVISGLVPSDYITPFEDEYDKLIAIVEKADSKFAEQLIKWQNEFNKIIGDLNGDYISIKSLADALDARLKTLEDKIKADGLLTQADLEKYFDDFKAEIQSGLDEINEFNESIKNLNVTDVAGGIPDYMMDTLNSAQAGIDKSKFNLIFATDYHYDIGTTYNPNNIDVPDTTIREVWESGLRKVLNATSLSNADAIVFNGDNIDQPAVKDIPLEKKMMLKELHDFLLTATSSAEMPAFILKGNHDGNYNHKVAEMNLTSVITDKEWSAVYDKIVPDYGENRNTGANYFYKDFDDKKIRLIGLDTYDLPETTNGDGSMKYNRFNTSGLQQAQLNWLANTALQVPEGTTVVISMHHPIDGTLATDSDVNKVINHDILMQIINDFVAGKSNSISGKVGDVPVKIDYTFKGAGTIAALLSGHFHTDGNVVKNGINFIQTRCSLGSGDNVIGDKRIKEYIDTPLEDAFDIVTIDTTAKTIDLKRVGAGSEDARYATRHFNY